MAPPPHIPRSVVWNRLAVLQTFDIAVPPMLAFCGSSSGLTLYGVGPGEAKARNRFKVVLKHAFSIRKLPFEN